MVSTKRSESFKNFINSHEMVSEPVNLYINQCCLVLSSSLLMACDLLRSLILGEPGLWYDCAGIDAESDGLASHACQGRFKMASCSAKF